MGTARTRQGSRNGADANVAPPDTKRSYVLRSSVVCHLCDGRMFGKTRHGNPYYSCQPGRSQGSIGRERDPNHPPTVYVREEALLDGILRFFGDRIFGPTRQRQGPMGQIREKSQKDSPCLDRRSSGFSRGTGRPIPTKTGRGLSFSLSSAARTAPGRCAATPPGSLGRRRARLSAPSRAGRPRAHSARRGVRDAACWLQVPRVKGSAR